MYFDLTSYVVDKIYTLPGPKHKSATDLNFRCPYCGDSKKSKLKARGHYYYKSNSFFCFNCGCSASAYGLIAQIDGISINEVKMEMIKGKKVRVSDLLLSPTLTSNNESIETVAKARSVELPDDIMPFDTNPLCKTTVETRRVFDAPFRLDKWTVYYSPSKMRMILPWMFCGTVNYWQARALLKGQEPKYLFPQNTERPIFPMIIDHDFPYLFIHEGVFNAIWCKNSIAAGAVKLSVYQHEQLKSFEDFGFKLVYIFDNWYVDKAAKDEYIKLAEANRNALFFDWDKSIKQKDLNDIAVENPTLIAKFSDEQFLKNRITTAGKMLVKIKFSM